jgi:hypothetical protein
MTSTSILTDIELNAVAGGSIGSSALRGMTVGAVVGGTGGAGTFPVGPATGTGGKPCNSNHHGVLHPL